MMIMQQTTADQRNTSIVIGINSHHPSSKQCDSTTGDNYKTGCAQALNTDKIDGSAGITNIDHCPRYAISQQYRTGWNGMLDTPMARAEINNAKNNVAMAVIISLLIYQQRPKHMQLS